MITADTLLPLNSLRAGHFRPGRSLTSITALLCLAALLLTGCVTAPPSNPSNICSIFHEKSGWYADARQSEKHWGVPISVQMAIIYQESRFVGDAKPPRTHLLWIIPWTRPSSAYGYPQALDSTWDRYKEETGNHFASRDDFGDAIDFTGWYLNLSSRTLGISRSDAFRQYLAYFSGQAGYRRGTYRSKPWLLRTARRVASRAKRYKRQLAGCRASLENANHGWWPF